MSEPAADTLTPATAADAELTARIRRGPPGAAEAALDELYRRHHEAVLSYARGCTRDAHTAEDLASEAFTRTLHAVRGGNGPTDAWRPYLMATVRRAATAWASTARRTELCSDFECWLVQSAESQSGEEQLLRQEEGDLVRRAFLSLPGRWQTVLWHSAVEHASADRIAPLLGISPSGVASLTARAREGLREAYLSAYVTDTATPEDCRHYTGLLAASVRRTGRIRRTHRALARHLADCARCGRAQHELEQLNDSLASVLPVGVLLWAGAAYGSKAAVPTGAATTPITGAAGLATGVGAALKAGALGASVLVVSVAGYTLAPDSGRPPVPPPAPTAVATTTTPTPTRSRDEPAKASPPSQVKPRSSSTPPPRRSSTPAARKPPWSPSADDRTQLSILATGRCLDISAQEGAQPFEASCDGGSSQQWELLVDRAAQEVRIRNHATGMCLTHTGTPTKGAPVRQRPDACESEAATTRWTYYIPTLDTIAFAQNSAGRQLLGLNDWEAAAEGRPHSSAVGTTTNYYDTPSLRFRYKGDAFTG
ncbi:sigma-70 family RNA polymerase sigma factor [Streptomyces luteolus]|uniref:Sigma-70 family RNA polymerase sigma factor n=1 Tax=Streptomyces luteolus TaxID=3043615 RepID=A0ABT6SXQ7_9ACTN|nr:sigma-70 family RNA polymerase sigma factor [Streptomyces sp. B-S-A12]MDI3419965.1 sigma-70 family RNA polymerase sigma factor [Streptomyces sp. B-S-A12]